MIWWSFWQIKRNDGETVFGTLILANQYAVELYLSVAKKDELTIYEQSRAGWNRSAVRTRQGGNAAPLIPRALPWAFICQASGLSPTRYDTYSQKSLTVNPKHSARHSQPRSATRVSDTRT